MQTESYNWSFPYNTTDKYSLWHLNLLTFLRLYHNTSSLSHILIFPCFNGESSYMWETLLRSLCVWASVLLCLTKSGVETCIYALTSLHDVHAWHPYNKIMTSREVVTVNCIEGTKSVIFVFSSPRAAHPCPVTGSWWATRRALCPCGCVHWAWSTAASSSCPPCCGGRGSPLHQRLHPQR